VAIAGQVVNPGDIVVGDEDGLVTFAPSDAERLLEAARRSASKEDAIRAEILTGRVQQSWLEPFLGKQA
jgi:regulator of RNase E activity RraA